MNLKYKIILPLIFIFIVPIISCKDYPYQKREARGIWITRWEYTSGDKKNNPIKQQEYIENIFKRAKNAKFNMIFFQVRGNADAYYKSDIEPWGDELTGTLGKDPGYDPLEFAVNAAHKYGLELHAWVNVFPAWKKPNLPEDTIPRHPLLQHPDWLICDKNGKPMPLSNEYVTFSPGNPDVQKHIESVIADITQRYDIDGIHLDYIRYPDDTLKKGFSYDTVSVNRFNSIQGNPQKLDWGAWQREQINTLVSSIYNRIYKIKPQVHLSAAVVGHYRSNLWNGYTIVYQDPQEWFTRNKIDFIVPMAYWQIEHPVAPFAGTIYDWDYLQKTMQASIYYGLGTYRLKSNNLTMKEVWAEIALVRESKFPGVVFFSLDSIEPELEKIGIKAFEYYSNVPVTKKNIPANCLQITGYSLNDLGEKSELHWSLPEGSDTNTFYFNIYSINKTDKKELTYENLIYVTPRGLVKWKCKKSDLKKYLVITALDRYNQEGSPIFIRTK